MGRPNGRNRQWTKEQKLRIVKRYFEERIGQATLAKEEQVSRGLLHSWITKYQESGEDGLENQKKKGNPFAALYTSKSLSEIERLRLEVMRKDIEIARLKKGYEVKGVGADKVFVSSNKKNMK